MLEVGRIGKPHGIGGDLFVGLSTDRVERLSPGSVLVAHIGSSERGSERELTVERSRPQGDRWVVHFVAVDTRTEAEHLVNAVLLAEPVDDPEALWVHDLIGSRVVDVAGGDHGTCVAVVDNPAHAILELSGGGLVPVPFVVSCVEGVITIDPPEGLLDDDSDGTGDGTVDGTVDDGE